MLDSETVINKLGIKIIVIKEYGSEHRRQKL